MRADGVELVLCGYVVVAGRGWVDRSGCWDRKGGSMIK